MGPEHRRPFIWLGNQYPEDIVHVPYHASQFALCVWMASWAIGFCPQASTHAAFLSYVSYSILVGTAVPQVLECNRFLDSPEGLRIVVSLASYSYASKPGLGMAPT